MSSFWAWFITLLVIVNILGYAILLFIMRRMPKNDSVGVHQELEHEYDGIRELNNPLPSWWIWFFWITIVFSVIYLFLYPGLGRYLGDLQWTSQKQWQQEVNKADQQYKQIFAQYVSTPVTELIHDPKALMIGKRLFENNCATCHGADAKGAIGFPNLRDHDWLYGGTPENIQISISNGRRGMMPPMAAVLGSEETIKAVVSYVRKLSGKKVDNKLAMQGAEKFNQVCAACHGANGKGNQLLGAPNLTDNIWLYGDSVEAIAQTIRQGRAGVMPAQKDMLSPEKIHLLTAYIYSLSANDK